MTKFTSRVVTVASAGLVAFLMSSAASFAKDESGTMAVLLSQGAPLLDVVGTAGASDDLPGTTSATDDVPGTTAATDDVEGTTAETDDVVGTAAATDDTGDGKRRR